MQLQHNTTRALRSEGYRLSDAGALRRGGQLMVALVVLSSRKSVMGGFVTGKGTAFAAVVMTVLIVLLNVVLIGEMLP
jgi:hypothetical protein